MRVLRVIRIFQLAKVWKNFQELLAVITNTVKDISNISILILLFIFTYTLLGMDLFAYNLNVDLSNPLSLTNDPYFFASTFDSFIRAFISVFIVLCNDGWTAIYFDHYRASGSFSSSIYFISLMIIGQYILLNLFIAILIENFEQVSVHQDIANKLNTGKITKCVEDNRRLWTSVRNVRVNGVKIMENVSMVLKPREDSIGGGDGSGNGGEALAP